MSGKFSLDDYVDVAERIANFKAKYPDGSLQTVDWKIVEAGGRTFIAYQAAAFRTADDERPGHGCAWEPFPGPTPYTKDSELMNAETAAWGRACVAIGILANRKIASRQEVQARQTAPTLASDFLPLLEKAVAAVNDDKWVALTLVSLGVEDVPEKVTLDTLASLSPDKANAFLGKARDYVRSKRAAA